MALQGDMFGHAEPENEPPSLTALEFQAIYNTVAAAAGWQKCEVLGPKRRKKIKSAMEIWGSLDRLRAGLERAAKSDFLTGKTANGPKHQNWKGPTLDFFLQEQSITNLLEGRYDNRATNVVNMRDEQRKRARAAIDKVFG